jgi:hypothetical protein
MSSFLAKLNKAKAEIATPVDPWALRLERVRGRVGDDGVERITTQMLFDHLEVLQRSRGAGACRRLAKVMRELGWTSRARGLTRGATWSRFAATVATLDAATVATLDDDISYRAILYAISPVQ